MYRLRAVPVTPDFEVTTDTSSYATTVGKPLEVTLTIARQHGFAESIVFNAEGLGRQRPLCPPRQVL